MINISSKTQDHESLKSTHASRLTPYALLAISNGHGMPGSSNNPVDISLQNAVPVAGIQFTLRFDSLLSVDSIALTPHISHMTLGYNAWDDSIKVLVYSPSGDSILPDSLPILKVFFSVSSETVESDSSLLHIKDCIIADPQAQSIPCGTKDNWFYFSSTGIKDRPAIPTVFALKQNAPNPFSQFTVISYQLPVKSRVSLKIYDLAGRLVKTLLNEEIKAGYHTIKWDGSDNRGKKLSSGIYFYRIIAGKYKATKKMMLVY